MTTHFGFKKVPVNEKHKLVEGVFDSVANRYDLMNDLMSFGIHRLWKRHAISCCQILPNQKILDLAGGTGDLTRLMVKKVGSCGQIILCDINAAMLSVGRNRLLDEGIFENVNTVQANGEALPFEENCFDRVIISFGLRNITHKDKALASIYRVLKPGGRLVILEFSHPTSHVLSQLYDTYSFKVLPLLGKYFANDSESYRYLAESIRMHPSQESLKALVLSAGFERCEVQNLSGGIVAIHKGIKY